MGVTVAREGAGEGRHVLGRGVYVTRARAAEADSERRGVSGREDQPARETGTLLSTEVRPDG